LMHPRTFFIHNYPVCFRKFLRASLLSQTNDLCKWPVLSSEIQKWFLSRDAPAKWNSEDTLYRYVEKLQENHCEVIQQVWEWCTFAAFELNACRIHSAKGGILPGGNANSATSEYTAGVPRSCSVNLLLKGIGLNFYEHN